MNRPRPLPPHPPRRSGATLTEVLMCLLIMGLGITSVFSLFPLSIVRSVRATNNTNAALLAETAREFFRYRRNILARPPAKHSSSVYAYPKDPFLYRSTTPTINNVGNGDTLIPEPFVGTFVVDPYGGASAAAYGNDTGRFGEVLRVVNGMVSLGANGLPGNSGDDNGDGNTDDPSEILFPGTDDFVTLDSVSSPDSWITDYEEIPVSTANVTLSGSTRTEFTFPSSVNLFGIPSSGKSRVLVVSANNRQSFSTGLDAAPNSSPANRTKLRLDTTLPASLFDPANSINNVGLVRLQNFERRYTYLFTLHRNSQGSTSGEIVVFFRREFVDSEITYKVQDNSITRDRTKGDPRSLIVENYTGQLPSAGDYVFGTWRPRSNSPIVHGTWYRIVNVSEGSATNEYRIVLDRPWEGQSRPGNVPRVMFPRGVVGVFDLAG